MTLTDLLTTLNARGALPASRVKDCKTSLRYLAEGLGHGSPEQCPVDVAMREEATWGQALETRFATLEAEGRTISAVTRRNTRNNLRLLFRLAAAHQLLTAPLPARVLTKPKREDYMRQHRETAPYQATYRSPARARRASLPQAQWPAAIQEGWREYRKRCGLRLREITFRAHANRLALYLGYLTTVCNLTPTWDDVFNVTHLAEFVRWHGARVGRPIATHGHVVVQTVGAMAVVLKHPHARELADFRTTLPKPAALHAKRAHWVSLATLEAVAEACLTAGRSPTLVQSRVCHTGLRRASEFQRGVVLKLLVRVPLRQRNVREMRLDEHLYQDQAGHWQLHFSGGDLKIGERQGQVNTYHVDLTEYCPDFLPVLDEFLAVHRAKLPNAARSPYVFLTSRGQPYTMRSLHQDLACAVGMRTGQRFYPHLIRTIWATEYLQATQDFTTAATMLGDTLVVVMRTYYDIVYKDQHAKAKAFLGTALVPR